MDAVLQNALATRHEVRREAVEGCGKTMTMLIAALKMLKDESDKVRMAAARPWPLPRMAECRKIHSDNIAAGQALLR